MRSKRVLRFTFVSLLAGAFVGLIAGLAFGGRNDEGTLKLASNPAAAAEHTATTVANDPFVSQPMTPDRAKLIGANEMGLVLVVAYNKISSDAADEDTRTPDQFRGDLALLYSEGFYPINISDLVSGNIDIPPGKSPVAITFDGSSPGQYRILEDGTLDPSCAVGIMQDLIAGDSWQPKATFFCLLDVVPNENELFGQAERQKEKLRNLVDWGYEVGSNTMTNLDLLAANADSIRSELANSQVTLQDLIGDDYAVSSLAIPSGHFPRSTSLLVSGIWKSTLSTGMAKQVPYKYSAAVGLGNTPCASPFSVDFDAMHVPRIIAAGEDLAIAIEKLKANSALMYISDGDSTSVSAPNVLPPLLGKPRSGLGRPVVRY
jgi:peptidoglycan/xylan/chitin deacetylase (PgdA/CDA1 family)